MSKRPLSFAVFGNTYQAKKSAAVESLLHSLAQRHAHVCIERSYHRFLTRTLQMPLSAVDVFDGDDFEADIAISMGGDGTFLRTASLVGCRQIPLLGVNMGRLGFLANANPRCLEDVILSLFRGNYEVEERELLQVITDGEPFEGADCALNDVAILKRDDASMISIHPSINGEYVTPFQADGLVVSTPTGSTAYILSNGGPIIVPGTKVFSLTAVAPHSLNVRPIVVPDDAELSLTVESRSHHFLVAIDGRSEKCLEGTRLTLRKAPYLVRIVTPVGKSYFNTLREKMMWGADKR